MSRKMISDFKGTGEPDAAKVARPVRRRAVGKVPHSGNSLAAYPTTLTRWQNFSISLVSRLVAVMKRFAFDEGRVKDA